MGNRIHKILSIMLVVVLCALVFVIVGQGNLFAKEDVDIDLAGFSDEEEDTESDTFSSKTIILEDPRQIDGTAYSITVLPKIESHDKNLDEDNSYAVKRSIMSQEQAEQSSNLIIPNVAIILLAFALIIVLALVYEMTRKPGKWNNKVSGLFLVIIMIISIFTVMQMNSNTEKSHDSVITVDEASDITESTAVLSGNVDIPEGMDSLFVSFEWDLDPGQPYSRQTPLQVVISDGYIEERITDLSQETTYYYRIKAVGKDYIYYSKEKSFETTLSEEIYYVHVAATGTGDGSSWENAFTDIEEALEMADPTDEILVALSEDPDEIGLAIRLHKNDSGEIRIDETLVVGPNDILEGTGNIENDVVVSGTFSPGHSPGIVTINGDLVISDGDTDVINDGYPDPPGGDTVGTLEIEIGGLLPGQDPGRDPDDGYDKIIVNGNVDLGGTLKVIIINNFVLEVGQTFDIIVIDGGSTGTIDPLEKFDNAEGLVGLGDGSLYFEIVQTTEKVQLVVKQFGGGGIQLKALGSHAIGIGKVLCDYFSDTTYTGTLENVDVLGLIHGSATFTLTKDVIDVDIDGDTGTPGDQYEDATLVTFWLSDLLLYIGKGSVGLYVTSGNLGIASIKESGGKSWLAVNVENVDGTVTMPGVSAELDNLTVKVNEGKGGADALNWTQSLDINDNDIYGEDSADHLDLDGNGSTTTDRVVYTTEYLEVSGSLSNLDVLGMVTGSAGFAFEQQPVDVDTDSDGTFEVETGDQNDLHNATLMMMEFTISDIFVGVPDSIGFSLTSGSLALGTIKPEDEADTRRWMSLSASITDASLAGIEGLTAKGGFDVEINRAYDDSDEVPGGALDWTADVDPTASSPDGGDFNGGTVDIGGHTMELIGDFLQVSGDLDLDLFNFVKASVGFTFVKQKVDVDVNSNDIFDIAVDNDLKGADMVMMDFTVKDVFAGVPDSIGFALESGYLALAVIKPSDPADDRSWIAVEASVTNAELKGIEGLTAKGSLEVEINLAFNGSVAAPDDTLDWSTDVNTQGNSNDKDDPFTETEVIVGSHTIDHFGELLNATGALTLDLFGFFYVDGTFTFKKTKNTVTVTDGIDPANDESVEVDIITMGVEVSHAFAGMNGPYWREDTNGNNEIDDGETNDAAMGLSLSGVEFGLAFMKVKTDDPETETDLRSWTALKAEVDSVQLVGMDGLVAEGSVNVDINTGGGTQDSAENDKVVEFQATWDNDPDPDGLEIDTGDASGTPVLLDYNTEYVRVDGALKLDVFGYVYIDGTFAFEKSNETINVTDGVTDPQEEVNVDILKIGATVTHAFAGVNGPYWREDPANKGVIDENEINEAAMGISLSNAELAMTLMRKKSLDPETETDLRNWFALKAEAQDMAFVGVEGFTLEGSFAVEINTNGGSDLAGDNDTFVDFKTSWSPDGLAVPTGETTSLTLNYEDEYLRIGGTLKLDVFGYVYIDGAFEFEISNVTVKVTDGVTVPQEDVAVKMIKVGATVTHAFAGVNGPYWRNDDNDNGELDDPDETNDAAMGISLSNVKFAMAFMKKEAADPETETDLRNWFALKAEAEDMAFVGVEGFTLEGSFAVEINTNGGSDLAGDNDTFVDFKTSWSPDGLPVPTGETTSLTIDFEDEYLRIGGTLKLDVFGYVYIDGAFEFEMTSETVSVTDGVTVPQDDVAVKMIKVGATVTHAFAGVNGPYWRNDDNDNGELDDPDETNDAAMGISLSNVKFAMAFMKKEAADPETETDLRNWFALKAEAEDLAFVGVEGFTLEGSFAVEINTNGGSDLAGDNDTFVDFKTSWSPDGLPVPTGETTSLTIDFEDEYLRIGGTLKLDVFGYVYVYGGFAFEMDSMTVTVKDGIDPANDEEVLVDILTVGAVVTHAFAGVDGPYWVDTHNIGVMDSDELSDVAMGLSLSNVKFALSLMKVQTDNPETETDLRTWTALSATTGNIEFVGVDGLSANGTATVKLNECGGTNDSTDNNKYVDFPTSYSNPSGLVIDVGIDPPLQLDFDGYYFLVHLGGNLVIDDLTLGGSFGFEMGDDFIGVSGSITIEFKDGDDNVILALGLNPAALLITQNGMAAQLNMGITIGESISPISFEGDATFYLNTTGEDVTEIAGETVDLALNPGEVEINKVTISILKIEVGEFIFFQAQNVTLDFTATGYEYLITFYGDEGEDGGLEIKFNDSFPIISGWGGSIGNFAISANFTFHVLPGFEIEIQGPSDATAFGLPSFLPIAVELLSFKFNPGAIDPDTHELLDITDFTIKFSGGLAGDDVWPITCRVDGMEIDIGKLANNQFPIVDLGGFEIGIDDFDLGPVTIGGGLTLGMVEVETSPGNTETAFYGGIEGKFKYSGIGGGLSLIVCQYGPILAKFSIGGLVLGPTGFVLGVEDGGFSFGGDPWPSVDGPEELLENPVFSDPFDIGLDEITDRVEQAVQNGVPTWNDSFTMAATGNITNLYVQGMLEGNVTIAANIGFTGPDAGLKFLVNGTLDALGMPMGFAGLLIDLSDPLVPQMDLAYSVPAPGNPLGFLFPSKTTILASLDTSGIIEMPVVGIATFISETFDGVLELVLEGLAEDLEENHQSTLSILLLDGGLPTSDPNYSEPDGSVDSWEDAIIIDGEFMVDRILGDDVAEINGILPLSFDALEAFTLDDFGIAVDFIFEFVPAIISQASSLAESDSSFSYSAFFDELVDVIINAMATGIKDGWKTFDPSLTITAQIQPMIFGIPLGSPEVDVTLRLDKYALQFSFAGSIRDLLLRTVFYQFGGELIANLPDGLDGINDSTFFSFKLEFPNELFNALVTGLSDPQDVNSQGLVDLMTDLINPFSGWEVLFASTIEFFDFKLGSVSGFIFGPQDLTVPDFDDTTFGQRVRNLDPDGDGEPNDDLVDLYTNEVNIIPINTNEQYLNIAEYGGVLLTGQLYMPDVIADPVSVITTLPEWASISVEISSGEFLTITATDSGTNHNNVHIIFLDEEGIAGNETVVYDDSNIAYKRLIITVEDGVSTAGDIIAAMDSEGTFTATTASLCSVIDINTFTTDQITDGGPDEYFKMTILIMSSDFEIIMEASSTGDQHNDLHIIFDDSVEVGSETAEYNDTNNILTIFVKNGESTAADIIAAINAEGTFTAWTPDSTVTIDLGLITEDHVTDGGVNGIDWTLPELQWDDLGDIMDNFNKVKDYIMQIIEGLKRQSEWAKLQIYIASPAELFNVATDILDTGSTQAYTTVTSLSDPLFEMVITAREYGPELNGISIIFQGGGTAGQETVVFDESAGTLTVTIQDGVSISSEIKSAINKEGTFFASCDDNMFVMTISDLEAPNTSGGDIVPLSSPKVVGFPGDTLFETLAEILNAGFIEGYSDLMLFGIELGKTFIEGTINGIRAGADIPWLAGLTAELETGWKEISVNQFFYDLVTSPMAEAVVSVLGLPDDPAEVFAFLLDESTPDVLIPFPVGGFESILSSENFLVWLSENFDLPSEVVTITDDVAAYEFFFGAYTPGFGGPTDSGVKRNGGFRLEGYLNIEDLIEDAWFEFEIEFFNPLENTDLTTIIIPNFIARASVPNLSIPGLSSSSNLFTLSDFYVELIKDKDEGLSFELEGSAMLLGLRFVTSGEFSFSDEGLYGGLFLEWMSGMEGRTTAGNYETPARIAIKSPGLNNDFLIQSVSTDGTKFNNVKVRIIDDGNLSGNSATAAFQDNEILIIINDGVTTRSTVITAVNGLDDWTVGASVMTDGGGDGVIILNNEVQQAFDFELSGEFILLVNTTAYGETITWTVGGIETPIYLNPAELRVHAQGQMEIFNGFKITGEFDVKAGGSSSLQMHLDTTVKFFGTTLTLEGDAGIFGGSDPALAVNIYLSLNNDTDFGVHANGFYMEGTFRLQLNTAQWTYHYGIAPSTFKIIMSNIKVNILGFSLSGSIHATYSSGIFRIDVPEASPLTFKILYIFTFEMSGYLQSNGLFDVSFSMQVTLLNPKYVGAIGSLDIRLSNSGFVGHFDGGGYIANIRLVHLVADAYLTTTQCKLEMSFKYWAPTWRNPLRTKTAYIRVVLYNLQSVSAPPPPPPKLATRLADGTLRLNMGTDAVYRGSDGITNENYVVSHVGGHAGNETVTVSALGIVQTYYNIKRIVANDAGSGEDHIYIDDGVLSDVVLNGGIGDDNLDAGGCLGVAIINGGNGNDDLIGGAGNDTLNGGPGNDFLQGGGGNDTMIGGEGDDDMEGNHDNDTYLFSNGWGDDLVNELAGGGSDTFDFSSVTSSITANIGSLIVTSGANVVTCTENNIEFLKGGSSSGDELIGPDEASTWLITGNNAGILNGMLTFSSIENLTGGTQNDLFIFGDGKGITGIIDGDGGTNTLDYSAYTTGIEVNLALHTATGTAGVYNITNVTGGSGNDLITGNADDNELIGGAGDDEVHGGEGQDLIHGGSGNDTIYGEAGDDQIYGEEGDDRLSGGDGDDHMEGGSGNEIMLGDNGLFGSVILLGGDGEDTMLGGDGEDEMYGQGGADSMWGNAQDDLMYGGAGNDLIHGGSGNDTIYGEAGEDQIYGDEDDDLVWGGDAGDLIHGGMGMDTIYGDAGDDQIYGEEGDDRLSGGDGDDHMEGGSGNDVMLGDSGLFGSVILLGGDGNDTMLGGDGEDEMYGQGGADSMWGNDQDDLMYGGAGNDLILGGSGNDAIYGEAGEDQIYGDEDDDLIWGGNAGDLIHGGSGNDTIYGEAGEDQIYGDEDDDLIWGGNAGDLIHGGSGNDTIYGEAGEDQIYGDEDDDRLSGGDGDDHMEGGSGNDVMLGDSGLFGSVILLGGDGEDTMLGGDGEDEMYGQGGADSMWGNAQDDLMYGGAGPDWIFGNQNNDTIYGEAGADIMFGDNGEIVLSGADIIMIQTTDPEIGGTDYMEGNDGNDILLGGPSGDWLLGNAGMDIILGDSGILDYQYLSIDASEPDLSTLDLIISTDPSSGGTDAIWGGEENDIVIGGTGSDVMNGDAGNDLIFGDHGKVQRKSEMTMDLSTLPLPSFTFTAIFTQAWEGGDGDLIYGNNGDDIILGQQGDDTAYGGEGDDDIIGGHNVIGGIDELDPTSDINDVLDGGFGNDVIAGDNAEILRRGDTASPRMRTLSGTLMYDENDNPLITSSSQENPSGAAGRNITLYDHSSSPIPNTYGNDYIAGGPDDDLMFGQLGDDIIQGDASVGEPVSTTDPSVEGPEDGDDYIEGNGGMDLIFGNLGQDDIIGGSSGLFGLGTAHLRPDGSDIIFGGAGIDITRNDPGDTSDIGHAQDADMILGDNGNIFRVVGTNGVYSGAFLAFNYDTYSGENGLKIIVRVAELLDYTPGGLDYLPTASQAASDIGASDRIHGESGDDQIYGMVGDDILFGEGQDDDLVGGYGCDWISGGTGQDAVLGDDGRIYTSRNGIAEPLYGIDDLWGMLNKIIYTPGKVQKATINMEGELKKTVNMTPFKLGDPNDLDMGHQNFDPQFADDIIFGGWGRDFLHGGDGDDAISGAEALESSAALVFGDYDHPDPERLGNVVDISYGNPSNPGNVLGFEAYRAEEFALYDEYYPRARILLDPGVDFLLNFNARDIDPSGSPAENNDGDDVIFGDLGNDWLVGGTGRDHLYGGYGCDLLSADDDLETHGGSNDGTDTDPTYEDFVFGGAGRDVLIANTAGDRLTDWTGEFNSYIVPFGPFGYFTVSRAPQPHLMDFLYDLSKSDGADPTRAADTGSEPDRNGEPEGELGLVNQHDFDWREQSGSPGDPQPGSIPSGKRDVLKSASFNDGSMEAFSPDSGVWEVYNGKLKVSAESIGGDAVSVFHIEDMLPIYYEIRATINAEKPTGGWKSNAYVIFDYQGPTDFKFAGINIAIDKIQMGRRTPEGWIVDVQTSCKLKPDQNYNMLVAINGTVVTVVVDGSEVFSHVFDPRIIDGYSYGLNQGMVGMGSDNSRGTYDNVAVQVLPPQYTFDETEDFTDLVNDLTFIPVEGDWMVEGFRYEGTPEVDMAVSLVDLGLNRGLEANCILELEATFNTMNAAGFVFDYYGPQEFKFVMISIDTNQVIIGHHSSKQGWSHDSVMYRSFRPGTDYTLFVSLKGSTVSVSVDGFIVAGYVFNAITVDGDFGLFTMGGVGSFDEVTVRNDDSAFRDSGQHMIAMAAPLDSKNARSLTRADLSQIVEEAISRWIASGLIVDNTLALLDNVTFEIVDLEGLALGHTSGNTVTIDINAAGWGWFVDATPGVDEEFTMQSADSTGVAVDGMDLLTVIMHELGHVLQLDHTKEGIMAPYLEPGMRLLPNGSIPIITEEMVTISKAVETPSDDQVFWSNWEEEHREPTDIRNGYKQNMISELIEKLEVFV